jgi:hypothetical protein
MKRSFTLVVLLAIAFAFAFATIFPKQTIVTAQTVDDTRPALEWFIWYRDENGDKKYQLLQTYNPADALELFTKEHAGESYVIICLNQPHYSRCEDRFAE